MRLLLLALTLSLGMPLAAEETAPPSLPEALSATAAPVDSPPATVEVPAAGQIPDAQALPATEELKPDPATPAPGAAKAEVVESRFKWTNFLLGAVGGATLGALLGPQVGKIEAGIGAAGGAGVGGLIALILGATTAPAAKPPSVVDPGETPHSFAPGVFKTELASLHF